MLLADIQAHILAKAASGEQDQDRRADRLHPSELCKDNFCPRAAYHRLVGHEHRRIGTNNHVLQAIFEEGHDIHRKHQNWLWEMGVLEGRWRCLLPNCRHRWWDTAPSRCPRCGFEIIDYDEVPIDGEEYLIIGHADLQVGKVLGEIKSVAKGTVRIENKDLYDKHTHKVFINGREKEIVDLEALWADIRRPFPTHKRQGQLYLHFKQAEGIDRIVFIYECKWNQQTKEFVVRYTPRVVEPLLDMCLDIKYALKKGTPPDCPHGGCSDCRNYEPGASDASTSSTKRLDRGDGRRSSGGQARLGETGDPPSSAPRLPRTRAADENHGPARRRSDGLLRPSGSLGRLLERAARSESS